jgi:molybdenum cofactor cytidylyltransferase/nicotine blue oxidoreductase
VVLGARAVDVWRRADLDGATVLANEDWETGMASSLRTGLDGLRGWPAGGRDGERIDAVLLLLVDMPGMTPEALRRVAEHAAPDALAVATYDGVRSHPVLIGREHWAGVIDTATGDEGARRYLAAHEVTEVDCTGLADPTDLDVPPAPGTVAP